MALHDPPRYRYFLPKPWDKETFLFIRTLAKANKFPKIVGTNADKNAYLVTLIRTQKSTHDWRDLIKDTIDQIKNTGRIDADALIVKYPPESISKDLPEWVTYEEDKTVSDFIDELTTRKVTFTGNDDEIGEFILRFILSQLGDWEATILMIWEMLGDADTLQIKDLNNEMKNFDYLKLFR